MVFMMNKQGGDASSFLSFAAVYHRMSATYSWKDLLQNVIFSSIINFQLLFNSVN